MRRDQEIATFMPLLKRLASPALKCPSTDILEVEGQTRLDRGSPRRLGSDHSIAAFPPLKL